MRHDVMCARYGFDTDPGQDVWGYEPPVRPCDCVRFGEVRADERRLATERVDRVYVKGMATSPVQRPSHDAIVAAIQGTR